MVLAGAVERMLDPVAPRCRFAHCAADRATVLVPIEMLFPGQVLATGWVPAPALPTTLTKTCDTRFAGADRPASDGWSASRAPRIGGGAATVPHCKMITGDHAGTATAIATEGVARQHCNRRRGRSPIGAELAALSADQYLEAVDTASVFVRVLLSRAAVGGALQARGHVAMTGDGVNDAPALGVRPTLGVAIAAVAPRSPRMPTWC